MNKRSDDESTKQYILQKRAQYNKQILLEYTTWLYIHGRLRTNSNLFSESDYRVRTVDRFLEEQGFTIDTDSK